LGSCYSIFSFMYMFLDRCLSFFFCPLCRLSCIDLRIMITPLVSSLINWGFDRQKYIRINGKTVNVDEMNKAFNWMTGKCTKDFKRYNKIVQLAITIMHVISNFIGQSHLRVRVHFAFFIVWNIDLKWHTLNLLLKWLLKLDKIL
jgi:hypothetical protein